MANDIEELRFNGTRYGINDERLASKANIDGAYEAMTVGNAEQLVGTTFEEDSVPYNFRTSGGSIDIGDREYDELVGGTVAWNQLNRNGDFPNDSWEAGYNAASVTISNGEATFIANGTYAQISSRRYNDIIANHVYLSLITAKSASARKISAGSSVLGYTYSDTMTSSYKTFGSIKKPSTSATERTLVVCSDAVADDSITVKNAQLFDLTQMFGSTIADYIYNLEQGTAGAGVAWFKKLFPKPYYPYNAGQLMSVKTSAHQMVGFNAWDEEWEVGAISSVTGLPYDSSNQIRSKNYCKCLPSTQYYVKSPSANQYTFWYDADKNFISAPQGNNTVLTSPSNAYYFKIQTRTDYGATYNHDICINLSWDGERDGEYEPYVKHEYALDSDLELRGIPKLDSANNLYYDGDTYEDDGTVTRKYGIVDLGTLAYTNSGNGIFYALVEDLKAVANWRVVPNMICAKYTTTYGDDVSSGTEKTIANYGTQHKIIIKDSAYNDSGALATALSGVYLVYELATPTTEEADPYQNPQIVDDFGTEEYVDAGVTASTPTRDVAIPVGHNTKYQPNLRAKLEMLPNSPDGDGDYLMRQANGENSFVPFVKELPTLPSEDGTYVLKCTVSGSTKTLGWVEEE